MTDVLSYLQSKGLTLKPASGGREVHTSCWWCNEPEHKRGRLYINCDPQAEIAGLFQCQLCGTKGALPTIQRHFGDATETQEKEDNSYLRRVILEEAANYYHLSLTDFPEHVQWLRNRGLSVESIRAARLGFADGGLYRHLRDKGYKIADIQTTGLITEDRETHRMVDFLKDALTIPYLVAGNVVLIRGRAMGASDSKYLTPPGQKGRLYNSDAVWSAEEVVVCEGELDTLSAVQMGFAAVGLPGANSFQESWVDYFADARRVYAVLDPDDAGRKGAQKVADYLGPKVRMVTMPDNLDLNAWAIEHSFDAEAFTLVLKKASGGLLLTVDDAYAEYLELQGKPGLSLGFPELDKFIRPGLLAGQVMVILAKSGTGKTLFKMNLMQRIATAHPEMRFLYLSLELTRGDWWERARRIYRFYHFGATDAEILEFWRARLMLVDKNRVTETDLLQVIRDYQDETGKSPMLVMDYLGYFARSFKGEPYVRTGDAVMALKGIAKEHRIPVLTSHQVSRATEYGGEPGVDGARDSVTGDTRILLADGSFLPIRDLVGTTPEVVTATPNYQLVVRPAVKVWEKGVRHVLQVRTESGRTFSATPEHPMLTADREWQPLSQLAVGDRVGVPGEAPVFGTQSLDHAELIGHLIADGGLTTSPITYTEGHAEIREHVAGLARVAGVDPLPRKGDEREIFLSNRGYQQSNPVTEMIRSLGLFGVKSPQRFLPAAVFTAPADDLAGVLRGLFASDGDITKQGPRLATASERLARDVQHALARFGVQSLLTREPYGHLGYTEGFFWRVTVHRYDSVLRFARKIGSVGRKEAKLERLLLEPRTLPHNVDLFPSSLWAEIHEARRNNGLGWAVLSRTGDHYRTSVVETRQIRRDRLDWLAEQVGAKRLRDLAKSSLAFERIVSIEPGGIEPVYDMTVVGTHNFVGDFVYSNSGVIEETADFVFPVWAPDMTKGRQMDEMTGELSLKIGKSRHGGTGHIERLVFAPLTLTIVSRLETINSMRASDEYTYRKLGVGWEEALERHEAGLGASVVDPKKIRAALLANRQRRLNKEAADGLSAPGGTGRGDKPGELRPLLPAEDGNSHAQPQGDDHPAHEPQALLH